MCAMRKCRKNMKIRRASEHNKVRTIPYRLCVVQFSGAKQGSGTERKPQKLIVRCLESLFPPDRPDLVIQLFKEAAVQPMKRPIQGLQFSGPGKHILPPIDIISWPNTGLLLILLDYGIINPFCSLATTEWELKAKLVGPKHYDDGYVTMFDVS
ncbi:hypothetical protein ACTXT7_000626 [Hymenolepis weldensis]